MVDLTKPTINYAPAGTTITDNTTLTITSTDDKINGSSTATITWTSSDGSATWNTTVNYNGTWTGTLNGLNANLTDGTITATINAQDWAGNQRTDTINSWTLNTTTATSIFALNYSTGMVKVGNYLSPTVRFTVTPPTGGSFTTTTQHSTLGQIGSHPTPETTQESWGWPGKLKLPHQRPNLDQCPQQQTPSIERPWTPTPTSSMAKSIQHQHCPSSARTQSWPTRRSLDQTHDYDWAT